MGFTHPTTRNPSAHQPTNPPTRPPTNPAQLNDTLLQEFEDILGKMHAAGYQGREPVMLLEEQIKKISSLVQTARHLQTLTQSTNLSSSHWKTIHSMFPQLANAQPKRQASRFDVGSSAVLLKAKLKHRKMTEAGGRGGQGSARNKMNWSGAPGAPDNVPPPSIIKSLTVKHLLDNNALERAAEIRRISNEVGGT